MSIGDRIKNERLRQGMTQVELSRKSGISQAQISSYERGIDHPRLYSLQSIAKALGVTSVDLEPGMAGETLHDDLGIYEIDSEPLLRVLEIWHELTSVQRTLIESMCQSILDNHNQPGNK